MTEAEWLACADPRLMLRFLRRPLGRDWWATHQFPDRVPRKWRLFAVACCRTLPRLNRQEVNALDLIETVADSPAEQVDWAATTREFQRLANCCRRHHYMIASVYHGGPPAIVAGDVRREHARRTAAVYKGPENPVVQRRVLDREGRRHADFLRCIFGNPFRPVAIETTSFSPRMKQLAAGIYQNNAFHDVPIFGDALEEAGCTSEAILNHCRQPGVHVRGCWAIDLVLGREGSS